MRVLVTGAGGFIGRHAMAALQANGIDAVGLGRHRPQADAGHAWLCADLLNGATLQRRLRELQVTHLLHLAWITEAATYRSSPQNAQWVDASVRLVQAFCDAGGQHAVVAGTCAEYDWTDGWCREESTPLNPDTPYGTAKNRCHERVRAICAAHDVRCAWARIFFPYGSGQDGARLIPSLVEALQQRIPPFGVHAAQQRDFIPAPDVARALLTLLSTQADDAFNISTGQPVRMDAIVQTLAELLGADPSAVLAQSDPGARPPLLVAGDNRRLKALGWADPMSLRAGLAQYLGDRGMSPRCAEAHPLAGKHA